LRWTRASWTRCWTRPTRPGTKRRRCTTSPADCGPRSQLTIAPNWRYVTGFHDDDPDTDNQDHHLFGLTVAYQPNERTTATLVVDNIFDEYYTPHLQNLPGEGITVKGALEIKLGVE